MNQKTERDGIADGIFAFLADRYISTFDAIEEGTRKAVRAYLDDNSGEIMALIAAEVASAKPTASVPVSEDG